MKLKSTWPVRRFFAFLGALYLFCAVTPLLFAESGTAKSESVFRIYDTATETVRTVNDLDFLCGALPCEMAVSAPDEALKAQIIAIHTLYDRKRRENTGKDFDFTCDSAEKSIYTVDAGLTDEEQNRVRALCLSVLDKEIYFENEPINACYFAISAGCTQPFENVNRLQNTHYKNLPPPDSRTQIVNGSSKIREPSDSPNSIAYGFPNFKGKSRKTRKVHGLFISAPSCRWRDSSDSFR